MDQQASGIEATSTETSVDEPDPFLRELDSDADAVREANALLSSLDVQVLSEAQSSMDLEGKSSQSLGYTVEDDGRTDHQLNQRPFKCIQILGDSGIAKRQSTFANVTSILARLSRNQLWAVSFSEGQILNLYLDALIHESSDSAPWIDDAIRLIANCCTRSHRTRVSSYPKAPIERLVQRLMQNETATISLKAICAVVGDYDQALQGVEKQYRVVVRLLEGIESGFYADDDADVLIQVLADLTPFVDPLHCNDRHLSTLADIPTKYELADADLATVGNLLIHLMPKDTDSTISFPVYMRTFLTFFANTYFREARKALLGTLGEQTILGDAGKTPEDGSTDRLRTHLIASCDGFAQSLGDIRVVEPEISILVNWIRLPITQAQIFACVFLGNVAYHHPGASKVFIEDFGLCEPLTSLIEECKIQPVLTSAFDLLQNLASQSNREALGQSGLLNSMSCHWRQFNPVAGRALYHSRQLIHDCPENAKRFLAIRSGDSDQTSSGSLLNDLLYFYAETEDTTVRAEVGKVVAEIWRTLEARTGYKSITSGELTATSIPKGKTETEPPQALKETDLIRLHISTSVPSESNESSAASGVASTRNAKDFDEVLARVFAGDRRFQLIEPVVGLIKSGNETLISQGWFTLSLMANREDGANAVYQYCIDDAANLELLQTTLSGATIHPSIRSNARYLVAMLAKQLGDDAERVWTLDKLLPHTLES